MPTLDPSCDLCSRESEDQLVPVQQLYGRGQQRQWDDGWDLAVACL
jgi:hypothetical protein